MATSNVPNVCFLMWLYVCLGDTLFISGPFGYISAEKICSKKILVLIAAGSGIYPFMFMYVISLRHIAKPLL